MKHINNIIYPNFTLVTRFTKGKDKSLKDKLAIGARVIISAIFTVALLSFQTWAVEPVIDRTVHGPFHFRDFRTVNESGLASGDFLTFGIDVVPNGDFDPVDGCADNPGCPVPPTTIVATQGGTTIEVNFSPSGEDASGESFDPNHFVRSVNYSSALTGSWQYTITNGSDVLNANTPTVGGVASMPKVTNMSLTGSGLTPTFNWTAPVIPNGLTLDAVTIEIRDLENRGPDGTRNARRIMAESISSALTSLNMEDFPGVLLANHRYEVGIQLDHRRSTGGLVSRSRSYFGFSTVILAVPGNAPVFLPSVDTTGINPIYTFDVTVDAAGQTIFIDPRVAVGYDYKIGSGNPKFNSVILPPTGNNLFDLHLWNGSKYVFHATVQSGVEFSFPSGGVDRFRVLGIEAGAGLDPNNATAFVTGLTFVSTGQFTGTMTPIVAEALCSVLGNDPKPSLLDQDIYTLQGSKGEELRVRLEELKGGNNSDQASLILLDNIQGAVLLKTDSGNLPNEVSAVLPATGEYLAVVGEQPLIARGNRFRGDYCLSVQSSAGAAQTLQPTGWVE